MNINAIAILFIGASMFIPLWIGAKASEKEINTVNDFFIQNREMGLITSFFTIQATWWSAFAFIGAASHYYYFGPIYWTTFGWDIFFGLLFFIVGRRIWFYGKENNYITSTDFMIDIYQSKALGLIVSAVMLLFTVPYFMIQIAGGSYLIEAASKGLIPSQMGAFLFTTVIVIYVWTGGLRAVAFADIFYEILIVIAACLGGFFILKHFGGMANLMSEVERIHPQALTLSRPDKLAAPFIWLSMFIIVPIGAFMGPQMWIRIYAIKENKTFYILPFLLTVMSIFNLAPMIIGNAGIALHMNPSSPDALFPNVILFYTPLILSYIILVGGAAAAMSTSNSQIHAISSIYTMDIHKRYINKKADDKRLLSIGRIVIVVFAIFSYVTYVYVPGLMIQIGLLALSGTAQIFVPTMGALFWEKSNTKGAISGIIAGLITLVYLGLMDSINLGIHEGLVALTVNALIFIAVSRSAKTSQYTHDKILLMKEHYCQTYKCTSTKDENSAC